VTHQSGQHASASGWTVRKVKGQVYPAITAEQGGQAVGLLFRDVSTEAMNRMNFFEQVFGFSLQYTRVAAGQEEVEAAIYIPDNQSQETEGPWDIGVWRKEGRTFFLEVAEEVMSIYEHQTADNLPVNTGAVAVRAQTRVRAKEQTLQTGIRHSFWRDDVEVRQLYRPYSKFFALEEYWLTHPKFDGSTSEVIRREVFASADAVTVLPYDPVLDKVVLIEQFRMGAYARGDQKPWLLEAVAGRVEVGQTPEETATREAEEEAGLHVKRLELISEYYTTPGAYNEYVYSYIGQVDLSGFERNVHGLATEHEDIATHLVSVDDLLPMLNSGQVNNSPLVISVLWLAINRDRLKKDWTGA
jgi:nudix-type nucleoside diphosphatase (YffH/AdpP family)